MIQIFVHQVFYAMTYTHLLGKYAVRLDYKDRTREKNPTIT